MTGLRVGLFGPHDHPAIAACAAALLATGNRPLIRNDNVFRPDPSQQEDFAAVVVIGESQSAENVMQAHEERGVPVYNIAADVGVADDAGQIATPLTTSPAYLKFAELIGAQLETQRAVLAQTAVNLGIAGDPVATVLNIDDAVLGKQLCEILMQHVGERGYEEGAVSVLNRIIAERDAAVLELAEDRELHRLQAEEALAVSDLPKIADLAAHLATLDLDGVTALQARDTRKTAAALYDARLEELTAPKTT